MPSTGSALWADCPWFELANGTKDGFAYYDDLIGKNTQANNVAAASTTLVDPWCGFTDATAGSAITHTVLTDTGVASGAVGVMALDSVTTLEGAVAGLHTALNTTGPIAALVATTRVWFETRIKVSANTTEFGGWFVGLLPAAKIATPATTVFASSACAAMAAIDHIGFHKLAAGTTAVKTVHGNGTATVLSATGATMPTAGTYTKLGMYWNGAIATFYQDGTALADTLALAATQFPAGANLGFHLAMIQGSDTGNFTLTADWVKYAFERTATVAT